MSNLDKAIEEVRALREHDEAMRKAKAVQQIAIAKQAIEAVIVSMGTEWQAMADIFTQHTGGAISGINIKFVEITEFGDVTKKSIFAGAEIDILT